MEARLDKTLHNLTKHEGANRADGNALATVLTTGPTQRLVPKSGDHPPEATVSKTDDSFAQFFPAYPNALAAEHTLIRVINEQGTARIYG